MLSENKEDYLAQIIKFTENKIKVSGKNLSEVLKVSPASVSEMLKKLKDDGLVDEFNSLTLAGEVIAKDIVSKHRIWEFFLVNVLNISWKAVDSQAHLLEHVTEAETLEALNKFLKKPKACPHGNPIYKNGGTTEGNYKLSLVDEGETKKIVSVKDDLEFLEFLDHENIKIGDMVTILSIRSFDAERVAVINDRKINLSERICELIFVQQ